MKGLCCADVYVIKEYRYKAITRQLFMPITLKAVFKDEEQ